MADACLSALGIETSARAVAAHYGARAQGGLIDGWLVDTADADAVPAIEAAGVACRSVPAMMTDVPATAQLAAELLRLADEVRAR
jgi:LPPG:FO 2-phospho-L-lactate transferase